MAQDTAKQYRVEVKARLVRCPRCNGWVAREPGMGNEAYLVCVNCGWEKTVTADVAAGTAAAN